MRFVLVMMLLASSAHAAPPSRRALELDAVPAFEAPPGYHAKQERHSIQRVAAIGSSRALLARTPQPYFRLVVRLADDERDEAHYQARVSGGVEDQRVAIDLYRQALSMLTDTGPVRDEVLMALGTLALHQGALHAVPALEREGATLLRDLVDRGSRAVRQRARLTLTDHAYARGRLDEARSGYMALLADSPAAEARSYIRYRLAWTSFEANDIAAARQLLDEAVAGALPDSRFAALVRADRKWMGID